MKEQEIKRSEKKPFPKKKGRTRPQREFDTQDKPVKATYTSGPNSVDWLKNTGRLSEVVSRIEFGKPLGYVHEIMRSGSAAIPDAARSEAVPGIMTCRGTVTAGLCENSTSPLNVASRAIWTYLRSKGTGALVDSPNEVATVILAYANLVAFVGWLERVNSIIRVGNPLNYYVRRGLLIANNVDPDDIINRQAELSAYLAYFASQVNILVMPKIDFIKSAYETFHHIYRDENISKGQFYMLVPHQFGYYAETKYTTGAGIVYGFTAYDEGGDASPWTDADTNSGPRKTVGNIKTIGDKLLSSLLDSQDVQTINAAILKAYASDGDMSRVFRISDIDTLGNIVVDEYSPEFLMQFHNLQYVNTLLNSQSDLYALCYEPVIPTGSDVPYMKTTGSNVEEYDYSATLHPFFDMFTEIPSNDEVLLASRLKVIIHCDAGTGGFDAKLVSFEQFLPGPVYVYRFDKDGILRDTFIPQVVEWGSNARPDSMLPVTFTNSPLLLRLRSDSDWATSALLGEMHNFTVIDEKVLIDIHRNNLMSLFNIPDDVKGGVN